MNFAQRQRFNVIRPSPHRYPEAREPARMPEHHCAPAAFVELSQVGLAAGLGNSNLRISGVVAQWAAPPGHGVKGVGRRALVRHTDLIYSIAVAFSSANTIRSMVDPSLGKKAAPVSHDDLDRLRRTARPVIFNTGIPEAPYSIKGSSFFAGYGGTSFVVTARHVVRDFPGNKLMFYPTEDAKVPVRIANSWRVVDDENDDDSSDLYIVQADFGHLRRRIRANARLIVLDKPEATAWFDERHVSLFFLCGYPSERNAADYENSKVNIAQVLVPGSYAAMALANGVHTLRVANPLGLDFDGLSGSPVFSMRHELAAQAPLRFCGMAIRGSATSGLVQFLEAGVVVLALKEAIEQHSPQRRPRPPSQRRAKP